MISYKKGDILKALEDGEIEVFGHGTNCVNKFGSGIAGQIKKKYPGVKKEFHEAHEMGMDNLGFCIPIGIHDGVIVNCYTQKECGYDGARYCDYEAIYRCLYDLKTYCEIRDKTKLGLPRIGCGLAGGSWAVVKAMIEDVFENTDLEVTVYEYNS